MLYLVGIGLKAKHITLEAIETIKSCKKVFVESYTSQYAEGTLKELEKILEKNKIKTKIVMLERLNVEEDEWLVEEATKKDIALLIFGNPLTATTHIQLMIDCKEANVECKIIPGISVTNLIAKSGLDEYRFGRTVTICFHTENFEPESFYEQMKENQKIGLHTLCLLDIKKDEKPKRLMNCTEGIKVIEKIASRRAEKDDYKYIALIGLGSKKEKIVVGKEKIVKSKEIKKIFPQSLIICGRLTEKEKEAIERFVLM